MEQVRTNGEQKELRDEIVDLGTRYGIVTPYTSYLALEGRETTMNMVPGSSPQPTPRTRLGGISAQKSARAPMVAESVTVTTGAGAVQQSKMVRDQKEADVIRADDAGSAVRRVAGKTFYLRDEVWVDSELKPDTKLPETSLTFGTDAYFELLKQKPNLAQYFSLGERVVVVFEGRIYRVNAAP
jgi:Ca-activated chloride channel family protein